MRAATFVMVALGLARALQARDGLVRNGGFSRVAGEPAWPTDWSAVGHASRQRFQWSELDGFNSNNCLTVRGEKGTGADGVTQTVACTAHTQFLLTAALKGSGMCRPMVRVLNAATGAPLAKVEGDTSGAWRRRELRFNSGNAANLLIQLRAAGEVGVAAIDAVQIYPQAAVPTEVATGTGFTPPGSNLARGKKYTLRPRPNYGYCTDPGDRTQLTDGVYTSGYFWTQKSTVGWTRASPVTITIDLGEIRPIAGASYNTAAGVAGVTWPATVIVLVSDDGRVWYKAGELVRETVARAPPPEKGYHVYRFAADDWKTKGRYVRLMIGQTPYCFVDEVEVYAGDPAWLAEPHSGQAFNNTKAVLDELFLRPQITTAVAWRLQTDLEQVKKRIEAIPRLSAGRTRLSTRIEVLRKRIEALPEVPLDLRTILPLNELHRDILALNGPVLRARGFTALTAWKNNRWAPLGLLDAPDTPPAVAPRLAIAMMRGEVRGETFNLTNPSDRPITVDIAVTGLPGGDPPLYVSVREVLVTDTKARVPVAAALPEAKHEQDAWQVSIPAGCTRQVWLSFERPPHSLKGGRYAGAVLVTAPNAPRIRLALDFRLFAFDFPAEPTLALGGWDYTNGAASYYRAPDNLDSLLALFQDCNVNTPWATKAVAPRDMQFDKAGALLNPRALDFSRWDQWVERWDFARNYLVFLAVANSFQGEKMGTPRFNRMVGDWFQAWAGHAREQGIDPERVGVLLVDEPHAPAQDAVIIAWARAIKAVETGIRIFEDPTYRDPGKGTPEMFRLADILPQYTHDG
ncbi:MAG: discoidin domain-containing protein [Kiritimatiellaeota bacterium]|nr:discoidin domain-containing protein [Kiritimatiellota bacterium]